jgi:PST family polysaccharide transporter
MVPNMTASLPKQATRGVLFTASAQLVKVALTLASTVTVARILSPADYGVIAMVAPLTALTTLLQDFGLNQALIQARDLSRQQVSAAFWVNLAIAFAFLLMMLLSAPLVASFYGDPRAAPVTVALGAVVFLGGFALQHTALLNRDLEFAKLALVDVASVTASFVVTLGCAFWLRSYWALVLGTAAATAVSVALVWIVSAWRPSLRPSWAAARSLFSLGGSITTFNVLSYVSRNLDNVLIARFRGPAEVGLYDRSYKLMMFPVMNVTAPLSRVMLPVLSRLRDEPERYRRAFLSGAWGVMLLTAPGACAAAATSERLISLLLGPSWTEAGPIFFWLSLAAIFQPLASATGWLFISSGRGRALVRWGVFSSSTTIASFAAGIPWGATGVAAAYVICSGLRLPLLFRWSTRETPVEFRDLFRALLPPAVSVLALFTLVSGPAQGLSTPVLLACVVPTGYLITLTVTALLPEGRAFLRLAWTQTARFLKDPGDARKPSTRPFDLT